MNRLKTMMLLAALTALFLYIGQALGGRVGMIYALVFAFVINFGSYWFSDKIVLRMYNANPLNESDAPELHAHCPKLDFSDGVPNAKTVYDSARISECLRHGKKPRARGGGRDGGHHAAIEYRGIGGRTSHELSHIKNRDTLISTMSATLAGALSQLANMAMWGMMFGGRSRNDRDSGGNPLIALIGLILAPLAAALIQMAISRSREFMADETGATICGKPLALASALQKIESWKKEIPLQSSSPATAHLFIINPLSGQGMATLFSTHPPTVERVKRLEKMAYKGFYPPHH